MKLHEYLDQWLTGSFAYLPKVGRRPWRAHFSSTLPYKSLNGPWDFAYFDTYKDAEYELKFIEGVPYLETGELPDSLNWPAQWELNGYGSPKYINQDYEWAPDRKTLAPPYIPPESIRLGIYKKTVEFDLPEGHLPILQIDGFEAAIWIFCGNRFIGYSNQGKNRNEFELPLSKDGVYDLTIVMTSLSSGSWLECQDMWRMSGAIRDIGLTVVPEIELFDVRLDAQLHDMCAGESRADLFAEVKILNHLDEIAAPQTVEVVLKKDGVVLAEGTGFTGNLSYRFEEKRFGERPEPIESDVMATAYVKLEDLDVYLWHPETPELYEVQISLVAKGGETVENGAEIVLNTETYRHTTTIYYGFREFSVRNGVFHLNNLPIKVQGVNRHEFDSQKGRAVDANLAETDLRIMKAANLNAVRVAHYPARQELYDVADRLGLMMMDEANQESHGISYRRNVLPGNDPRWYSMALDRVSAIFETHKNHPSIFSWSIGNEIGWGEVVQEMAAYLRAKEDGRLIHKRQMNKIADFNSENYGRPEFFESFATDPELNDKCFLSTEYAHAMGNSMGDIARYTEIFRKHPNLAGGFVWEWCDHALNNTDGKPSYGGQFDEVHHDGNFCIDGVVTSHRDITDKLLALRQAWSYFTVDLKDDSTIQITSRLQVLTAEDLQVKIQLMNKGVVYTSKTYPCPPIRPEETVYLEHDLDFDILPPNAEIYLSAELIITSDTTNPYFADLAVIDPVLVTYQHRLRAPETFVSQESLSPFLSLGDGRYRSESGLVLLIDLSTGAVSIPGKLKNLDLSLARAATDNDRRSTDFYGLEGVHRGWKAANLHNLQFRVESIDLEDGVLKVMRTLLLGDDIWRSFEQTFACYGLELRISNELDLTSDERMPLPRVGLKFQPEVGQGTCWYGGSNEAYPDRRGPCEIGLFRAEQGDFFNPTYLKPQENGLRDSVRYVVLADDENVQFSARMDRCFSLNRQPWSTKVLEETASVWELEDVPQEDTVYLDVEHAGLGNRSCGPETSPAYKLLDDKYTWKVYLDFSMEGQTPEQFATAWQWPEDMFYRNFEQDLAYREDGGFDFREQLASRGASQYRDPSDRDVREEQGF